MPTGLHGGPPAALRGPPPPVDIGIPRGIPLGEEVNLATMVLQGRGRTACYKGVSLLRHGGMRALAASWRMDQERVADAEARLSQVVSVAALRGKEERPGELALAPGPNRYCLAPELLVLNEASKR